MGQTNVNLMTADELASMELNKIDLTYLFSPLCSEKSSMDKICQYFTHNITQVLQIVIIFF